MTQPSLLERDLNDHLASIYQQYEHYMEGYSLYTMKSVFIPFYRVNFKVSYTATTEMNLLEEFICRLISMEVMEERDILDVLSLDEEIFSLVIADLIRGGFLLPGEGNTYRFTEEGRVLFDQRKKHEKREDYFSWYFDALSDEYVMNYAESEELHNFRKAAEIDENPGNLIIPPKAIPEFKNQRDKDRLEKQLLGKVRTVHRNMAASMPGNLDEIVSVENMEMISRNQVLFHEFYLFYFTNNEGNCRLIAHDPCGQESVDSRVTKLLEELREREDLPVELNEVMEEIPTIENIIQRLKDAIFDVDSPFTDDEKTTHESTLNQLINKPISMQLMGTLASQRKFHEALHTAKKNLYIISPWMNSYVVNHEFEEQIKVLLKRNVDIHIRYGIDGKNAEDDKRMVRTEIIAEKLRNLGEGLEGHISVIRDHTHEKVIMWDDQHFLLGSYNFLSYSAESDPHYRNELCIYTDDADVMEELKTIRFKIS